MAPGERTKELRHIGKAVPLALALMLVMGAVAMADNLSTNGLSVNAGTSYANVAIPTSGNTTVFSVSYTLQPTGNDGCNVSSSNAGTLGFPSLPTGVSVTGGSSWTSCGTQNVQLTVTDAAGAGTYSLQTTFSGPGNYTLHNNTAWSLVLQAPSAPGDTTPPVISYTLNPSSPDGDDGWYKSDVTLTWIVTEAESPSSLVKTGCVDQNITADQATTTYSCSARSDGGSAGPVGVSIKRDATAPTLSCNAASFLLNQPNAEVTASVSDELSLPLTAMASAPADTSSAGSNKAVTIRGYDNAGNWAEKECSYSVGYNFDGLYAPVDRPSTLNVSKAGQAIPLKWRLTDYFGSGVTDLTAVNVTASSMSCTLGTTTDALEEYASGSSGLQNLGDGHYQFNWKTPTTYASSCKSLSIKMGAASSNAPNYMNLANFQFKK